tara:strand:+ start:1071 stop:1844 length:774 start_codon:yes stop_codon:yes gene_type:complete
MIDLLGYLLFIFAGLFFGLFGSGGSIIIIPILIYIFKINSYEATTYSLLLVFFISIFGTLQHVNKNNLHLKKILFFIIPTLLFTAISRIFIFPNIPNHIQLLNISKESLLMIVFSIVIFLSACSLFKSPLMYVKSNFKIILILTGVFIGIFTGLLGIGGGFIILPALILFAKMDMKQAASSTLFIIMLNTLLAIMLEITIFKFEFKWDFIVYILLSSFIGVKIGMYLLNKIDVNIIKKLFSFSLLLLSLLILLIELL